MIRSMAFLCNRYQFVSTFQQIFKWIFIRNSQLIVCHFCSRPSSSSDSRIKRQSSKRMSLHRKRVLVKTRKLSCYCLKQRIEIKLHKTTLAPPLYMETNIFSQSIFLLFQFSSPTAFLLPFLRSNLQVNRGRKKGKK